MKKVLLVDIPFGKDNQTLSNKVRFEILNLTHPGTGDSCQFALCMSSKSGIGSQQQERKTLMEINKSADPEISRSWFIGDSVTSDGCLFLYTPMDPLFLVLPLLEENKKQFSTLGQILREKGKLPDYLKLLDCVSVDNNFEK